MSSSSPKSEHNKQEAASSDSRSVSSLGGKKRKGTEHHTPSDTMSEWSVGTAATEESRHSHKSKRGPRSAKELNVFRVESHSAEVVCSRVVDLGSVRLSLSDPEKLTRICTRMTEVFTGSEKTLTFLERSSAYTLLKALDGSNGNNGKTSTPSSTSTPAMSSPLTSGASPSSSSSYSFSDRITECVSVVADWCEQENKTVEKGVSQDAALYALLYTYYDANGAAPGPLIDARLCTFTDVAIEDTEREKALFGIFCKTILAMRTLPELDSGSTPELLYFGTTLSSSTSSDALKVGRKVVFPGFVSAVDSLGVLANLFPGDSGTVYEVRCCSSSSSTQEINKNLHVRCIQQFSLYPEIKEYVIEPFSTFVITEHREESDGKITVVTLEPVAAAGRGGPGNGDSSNLDISTRVSTEELGELSPERGVVKTYLDANGNDMADEDEDGDGAGEEGAEEDGGQKKKRSKKKIEGSKLARILRKNNKKAVHPAKSLVKIANTDLQTEYDLDKEFFDVSCEITRRVIKSSKRLGHSAASEKQTGNMMTSIPAGFGKFEG